MELKAAKEEARVQSLKDDLVALEVRATKLKQERDELREAKRELVGDKEQMGRTLVSLKEQVSEKLWKTKRVYVFDNNLEQEVSVTFLSID